ncbi:MAG: tetratricopeptide repeat protein [Bacteroidales bacterium]|nr:tetratricopeptide repeat protein [Bacteroidales bacterium]
MKRIILLFLLLSSLSGVAKIYSQEPDEADPYFLLCGEADEAIAEGKYEEAAERLWDAIMMRPQAPQNLFLRTNLGLIYSYIDKDSLALSTLEQVIEIAPTMKTPRANRARVLLKLGRDADALEEYQHILELDSTHVEARYYRGMMALYNGVLDVAEQDFGVLKETAPESLMTARALSSLYSMTGRDREAIPYFKKLLEQEKAPEYYSGLAGCYIANEDYNEASELLAEAIQAFPEDPELYYYRAQLNRKRYRIEEARQDAAKAVQLGLNPSKVADF